MKKGELVFRLICLVFSMMLLVLSLLWTVRLSQLEDKAAAMEKEIAGLQAENQILLAKYESCVSLEKIERYAIQELGMQHCSPGQIFYLELPEN